MKIEKLEYYSSSRDGYTFERHPNIDDITDKINEIIDKLNERDDVEHVIKCKDCKYNKGEVNIKGYQICSAIDINITDDDYCS